MNDKYLELKKEYDDLNTKLSNPDKISNQGEFKIISSRISQLSPIIENINKLISLEKNIKETELILEDESIDKEMKDLANSDLFDSNQKLDKVNEDLNLQMTKSDPNDVRNVILEIRAGTGGEEAALFASEIHRMYVRYAESNGWKVEHLSTNRTGNGGYKEVILIISGDSVYGKLKYENGVHRVQRIPATESSGRVHTSAVSVVALPEVDDIEIDIDENNLRIDVYRSSGPGGQSVNTTDSAVRITHIPTGIVISCQDEKSQHKNKARALSILKSKLYELEQEKQSQEQGDIRNAAIRGGDRSAKIRTYNFQQSRVTDHRIKKSWYNLDEILNGSIDEVVETTNVELAKLIND